MSFGHFKSIPDNVGISSALHIGHLSGIMNSFSLPVLSFITGPTTSGITSPAFLTRIVSPISKFFSLIYSRLCRVALLTVEPIILIGSNTAFGVIKPVLPTVQTISVNFDFTSSAGNLYAITHFGYLAVLPSSFCMWISFTLITIPSIS